MFIMCHTYAYVTSTIPLYDTAAACCYAANSYTVYIYA